MTDSEQAHGNSREEKLHFITGRSIWQDKAQEGAAICLWRREPGQKKAVEAW